MSDDRLPTSLWVEAHLHVLTKKGQPYYIVNKGAYASGTVMVKINGLGGECVLLQQQRDLDGNMGWMRPLNAEAVAENEADDYIRRSIDRDPDLWVIEVEDKEMNNPFDGKIF